MARKQKIDASVIEAISAQADDFSMEVYAAADDARNAGVDFTVTAEHVAQIAHLARAAADLTSALLIHMQMQDRLAKIEREVKEAAR